MNNSCRTNSLVFAASRALNHQLFHFYINTICYYFALAVTALFVASRLISY